MKLTRSRFRLPLLASCVLLYACQKGPAGGGEAATPPAANGAEAKEEPAAGVVLTPEQIEKLGIVVQPAKATQFTAETSGFGVVVNHDTIAQAAADLITAQAGERLSRSALARARKLTGTPGAVSVDVEETAAQKAEVDAATLTATNQKLSSILGMKPPWKSGDKSGTLQALAGGTIKLVRVTFPLGAITEGTPETLRAAHLGGSDPRAGWKMTSVWDAPADANVPGRSFFALLKGSDAGEGERLQVWAPRGDSAAGVVIPTAAAVMSEGKYWCYVQKKPGTFVKVEIDAGNLLADGYFVTEGVAAGDQVVTTAVGQLLAKDSGSAAEPD